MRLFLKRHVRSGVRGAVGTTALRSKVVPLRVIHRDIKPSNVLIRASDGAVKVTDFGIAAVLAERSGKTAIGTLSYMAPEQAMGLGVDERSDLYSLGAMLYEMLTGQRPPQLASAPAQPPSLLLGSMLPPEMSQRIDALVLGLLRADRTQRVPQSAAEVGEELRALLEGRQARPVSGPQAGSGSIYHAPTQRSSQPIAGANPYAPTERAGVPPGVAVPAQSGPQWSGVQPKVRTILPVSGGAAVLSAPAQFQLGRATLGGIFGLLFGFLFFFAWSSVLALASEHPDIIYWFSKFDMLIIGYPAVGLLIAGAMGGYAQASFKWGRAARAFLRTLLVTELLIVLLLVVGGAVFSGEATYLYGAVLGRLVDGLFVAIPCGLLVGAVAGCTGLPFDSIRARRNFMLRYGSGSLYIVLLIALALFLGKGSLDIITGAFPNMVRLLAFFVVESGALWGILQGISDYGSRFIARRFGWGMMAGWAIAAVMMLVGSFQQAHNFDQYYSGYAAEYFLIYSEIGGFLLGIILGLLFGLSGYLNNPSPFAIWVRPLAWLVVGLTVGACLGLLLGAVVGGAIIGALGGLVVGWRGKK